MAWDDTKEPNDDILSDDYNSMVTDQKTRSKVSSGAGAPSSTPTMVGAIYYDTTNGKFYIANGTDNSDNWRKILTQ